MESQYSRSHHSPLHIFVPNTMYIVTASTLYKQHFFRADNRRQLLQDALFEVTTAYDWPLQAWAIFANHYHFIAKSPDDATTLKKMIQRLHSQTARAVNRLDGVNGRQVWFQYWDTCLMFEQSYYARLNYVHNNPVKHGLVEDAVQYPFCSASWFNNHADIMLRHKITSALDGQIDIQDDFTPPG